MFSDKMKDMLNKQVNAELQSWYIYLGMAAYFDELNLDGFSHWMQLQAAEERSHAMRIYEYLYDRGARVELLPLTAPPVTWDSPLAAFQNAYEHEAKISGLINDLMNQAIQDKDHATQAFLHWFVTEQVEEEATADHFVHRLKLVGDSPTGLFVLNQEMAKRAD